MRSSRAILLISLVVLTVGAGAFVLWVFALPPALEQAREAEPLEPPLERLEPSWLHVPVTYPVAPLTEALDGALPRVLLEQSEPQRHPADANLRYQLAADRGEITLTVEDSVLVLNTDVRYRAALRYDTRWGRLGTATCGTGASPAVANVQVRSPLALTPDWHLDPELQIDHVRPAPGAERCRVQVLGFERDVTDLLLNVVQARFAAELPAVEATLRDLPLPAGAEGAWEQLAEARMIASNLTLALQPHAVEYALDARAEASDTHVQGTFYVRVSPQLLWGSGVDGGNATLPPLQRRTVERGASEDVSIEALASYPLMAHLLQQALRDVNFTWQGRTVGVQGVHIASIGQRRVVLTLQLDRDATGALHLVGTPVWDAEAERLRIPDLDLQVDSAQRWVRTTGQLARRFLRPTLRRRVSQFLEDLPLLELLPDAQALAVTLTPEAHLYGQLRLPTPTRLAAEAEGLRVQATLPLDVSVAPPLVQ